QMLHNAKRAGALQIASLFCLQLPLCVCTSQRNGKEPEEESVPSLILSPQLLISSSPLSTKHITHSFSPTTNAQNPSRKKAKMAKKWWTIRDFKCETGCGTHAQTKTKKNGPARGPPQFSFRLVE
ncbi:hypothetical protein H0G86_000695, partial [Trichoderma simmonsii]